MLVGTINDPSALGALRAFQEAGRTEECAIMGQNASPEGRAELRGRGTRLIGSVAYFPEKYGPEIVTVALDILHRRPVPPAVFVKHQLVTPENVDHVYPNDELIKLPVSGPSRRRAVAFAARHARHLLRPQRVRLKQVFGRPWKMFAPRSGARRRCPSEAEPARLFSVV
jgi:hypothetical protein